MFFLALYKLSASSDKNISGLAGVVRSSSLGFKQVGKDNKES